MKKKLIIFGAGKIAEVVYYYAKEECGLDVVAFTVDAKFKTAEKFAGLPLISFEALETQYRPSEYAMFVAVGYHDMNRFREDRCRLAREKGYELVSIISPAAKLPLNVSLGYNCFIMTPSIIHPFVSIGNNVFVWSGAIIGHHSKIGDNCWITSSCNIGGNVQIGDNTFIALNATISHSVSVGKECFLGSNTLVTKQMEDEQVVISESSKPIRLNSRQFLKISNFSSL